MVKKAKTFLVKQKIAVGVVAMIVLIVIGYFSTLVIKDTPILGEFVEGEHFTVLENPRRVRGPKIEVMEFFSYACIHCYNFDPALSDWARENETNVDFVRTPAVSNDYWRTLGRNYYTLEKLGLLAQSHLPFFREVHEVKRNFTNPERIADYFDGKGTTRNAYLQTFNSTDITRKITLADQLGRRLQVAAVPTIVVHGKYMVRTTRSVGTARMLDVMDYLVNREIEVQAMDATDVSQEGE